MTTPTNNNLDANTNLITSRTWYDDNRLKSRLEEERFRWMSAICMELPFVACGLCSSDNSVEDLLSDLLTSLRIDVALYLKGELEVTFAEQSTDHQN